VAFQPGGGIGHTGQSQPHRKAGPLQRRAHLLQQPGLAAEQMRAAGHIEQQAVGAIDGR
jgi:hypothetical protein